MSDRDQDNPLTRALRAVAEQDKALGASPHVETRLLFEARTITWRRRRRAYAMATALAATIVAVIAIPMWRGATNRSSVVDSSSRREPAAPPSSETTTDFYPLMYSNVPISNAHTVRLELPNAALASLGLDSDDPSDTVLADVLVGQDGLARAVRFVRPVTNKEPR